MPRKRVLADEPPYSRIIPVLIFVVQTCRLADRFARKPFTLAKLQGMNVCVTVEGFCIYSSFFGSHFLKKGRDVGSYSQKKQQHAEYRHRQ